MISPTLFARRIDRHRRTQAICVGECLERRQLLAAVPFGASADDTAEFMLGEVLVSVVLLESNGQLDADTENWQPGAD